MAIGKNPRSAIIDGRKHAAELLTTVGSVIKRSSHMPHLAVILVGDDPASQVYISNKQAACEKMDVNFTLVKLPADASTDMVIQAIDQLNTDDTVHAILVQHPLPQHISKYDIAMRIATHKDVDAMHPQNLGLLAMGTPFIEPCTPAGILYMLKREGIEIAGKHAVIVGRSDIVGKPMALMLLRENATVTVCHSHTPNLREVCNAADLLVSAMGNPRYVTVDYVKDGAVVIDVGINRNPASRKLCGDVDFENVLCKSGYITPVPGGVGPMTIAMLIQNVITLYRRRQ